MQHQQHISPDEYLQKYDLNKIVQDALNATYQSKSSAPVSYLATYFKERNSVNAIQSVTAREIVDGCGSVALEVKVVLANGVEGKAVSSHSNRNYHGVAVTGAAPTETTKGGGKGDSSANAAGQLPPGASGNVGHPSTARIAVLKTDKTPTTDAKELRRQRFGGNGLLGPVQFITENIAPALVGLPVSAQDQIDSALQSVDGTENFANVGAQCAAAVSIAIAETASKSNKQPAFVQVASNYFANIGIPRYLSVPTPVVTLFSAEPKWLGKVRVLEVCLVPNLDLCSSSQASPAVPPPATPLPPGNQSPALSNAPTAEGAAGEEQQNNANSSTDNNTSSPQPVNTIRAALEKCMRVFEEAQAKLHEDGHVVVINPDGGLKFNTADSLPTLIDYTEDCIKEAGFVLGQDFYLALIVDGSFCYKPAPPSTAGGTEAAPGKYALVEGQGEMTGGQLAEFFANFIKETKKDKICYLEDPLHDKDAAEMKRLMFRLGGTNVAVASNNFTACNLEKVVVSANEKQANTLVLRMNDCGSITNAISAGQKFQSQYPGAALSVAGEAFLGENSGSFLADLATGVGAKFLRGGGLLRSDHAAVYNRLAEIEEELETLGLGTGAPKSKGLADFSTLELPPAPTEPVVEVNAKDAKKKR